MLNFVISVPIIVALVEVIKRLGMNSKFAPLLAVVIGIGGNLIFRFLGAEVGELVLMGLVTGLTACGLYDGIVKGKEVVVGE